MSNGKTYEDVDPTFEYLDLSDRRMGIKGIEDILEDIEHDTLLKHLDLSYNITSDETEQPSKMKALFNGIVKAFRKNKTLTALDLAGNHLFQNSCHPLNEHLSNYLVDFTNSLIRTNIRRINLKDNNLVGTGRKNKGLAHLIKHFAAPRAIGLTLSSNSLYSPSFVIISTAFHPNSTLTYLDLSDNKGGLNPNGVGDSEGIYALMRTINTSTVLAHLILSNNCLRDDDVVIVSDTVAIMPTIRTLGLAGNECHGIGADALKRAILSHCALEGDSGIRDLDISSNPLGNVGIGLLNGAFIRSQTLTSLNVSYCQIDNEGIVGLQEALAANPYIVKLDVHDNPITTNNEIKTLAEAAVNRYMVSLAKDPHAVNASKITHVEYMALAKKLRFMEAEHLRGLHGNPSFNIPLSVMQESLHLLQPPQRTKLFKDVKKKDAALNTRLVKSLQVAKQLAAAHLIYRVVTDWFEPIRVRNAIRRALAEARKKTEEANKHNADDDEWGQY